MRNLKKMIILITMITVSMVISAGCGTGQSEINNPDDAKIEVYRLGDLNEVAYIQKGDNEFIKFMDKGKGYKTGGVSSDVDNHSKIVWFANQDGLIPEMTGEDRIIMMSQNAIPERPMFHPMEDYGYTIGCTLYEDSKSKTWALSQDPLKALCVGSSFNKNFLAAGNGEATRLFDIGGMKITAKNVSTIGTITGLEPGKEFPIGLYNGTKYSEITAVVDTHVFVDSLQIPYVAEEFQFTKDGYIIVTMPKDMPSGYYYFDELGLFKYSKS